MVGSDKSAHISRTKRTENRKLDQQAAGGRAEEDMSTRKKDTPSVLVAERHPAASPTAKTTASVQPKTTSDGVKLGTASELPSKDVTVKLQYLAHDPIYEKVKPLQVVPGFLDREGKSNVRLQPGEPETIVDIRHVAKDFTLDDNGFCYVKAPTSFKDWTSQSKIGEVYLPEMEDLLRRELDGVDEIMLFDARIRHAGPEGTRIEGLSYNPFARQVHVDQTESSIVTKIRNLTDMKASYLLQGRCQIINIWRPIKHPVYDCALAIADGGELTPRDVIECDRKRLDTGEFWDTMGVVQYRKGYHWYYMSEQDEEDVLLFKNYDSDREVRARHCLHTAFDVPPEYIPPNAPTRESIEVRALVFTYPPALSRPDSPTMRQRALDMPQPLASALQKGQLQRVDQQESTIHMLRHELEQAKRAQEEILSLRRREMEEAKERQERLLAERDRARADLKELSRSLKSLDNQLRTLKTRNPQSSDKPGTSIEEQLQRCVSDNAALRERLEKRERNEMDGLMQAGELYGADAEKALLNQRIEMVEGEYHKWRNEALGKGSLSVSSVWQASVDEAVRKERTKDEYVIQDLRREIERLKAGKSSETGRQG